MASWLAVARRRFGGASGAKRRPYRGAAGGTAARSGRRVRARLSPSLAIAVGGAPSTNLITAAFNGFPGRHDKQLGSGGTPRIRCDKPTRIPTLGSLHDGTKRRRAAEDSKRRQQGYGEPGLAARRRQVTTPNTSRHAEAPDSSCGTSAGHRDDSSVGPLASLRAPAPRIQATSVGFNS